MAMHCKEQITEASQDRSWVTWSALLITTGVLLGLVACAGPAAGPDNHPLTTPTEARDWLVGEDWIWLGWSASDALEIGQLLSETGSDPERYRIRLIDPERLAFRADCNQGGGQVRLEASRLEVGLLMMTRAYCGDASLSDTFAQGLEHRVRWQRLGDRLWLIDEEGHGWVFALATKNPQ